MSFLIAVDKPSEKSLSVWLVPLDRDPVRGDCLSGEEKARAERFHFPEHRRRYLNARIALRHILGTATNHAPAALVFVNGEHGKPAVLDGPEFNLSHSADLALIAIASTPIGVDLEATRADVRCLEIAERFFTPRETAALRAMDATAQRHRFFQLWTAKEARMKATGHGLALSPQRLEVAFTGDQPSTITLDGLTPWPVHPLPAPPGFTAALVGQCLAPPRPQTYAGPGS